MRGRCSGYRFAHPTDTLHSGGFLCACGTPMIGTAAVLALVLAALWAWCGAFPSLECEAGLLSIGGT